MEIAQALAYLQLAAVIVGTMLLGAAANSLSQMAALRVQSSESAYSSARATFLSDLASWEQANPNTSLSNGQSWTWSSGSASATAVVEGDTMTSGSTLTAANLEENSAVNERRVGIDISVQDNSASAAPQPASHRIVVRLYDQSPYYDVLSDVALGTTSDRVTAAAADPGGCASSGSGCDTTAVQSQDDSTLKAHLTCVLGPGSGTCPGSGQYSTSTYGTKTWSNAQTSESP